jgi:hypothetical protein
MADCTTVRSATVSFDLAVWEGPRPASNEAALAEYERMMDQWQGEGTPPYADPTPAIRGYVAALLSHWPDITGDDGDDSPWADGPIINNATGPIFYFSMVWSQAEQASAYCAEVARAHGLVCFDPQSGVLR